MKRLILTIAPFMATIIASAANIDSALVEHTSLRKMTEFEAMRNPALHGFEYKSSFSQLSLGIDMQRQSQAFIPEKGTGHTLPFFKVNTYHHLNGHSTVWGDASYTTGKQHDIRWNSTSDYDLLQPYILADTLGGDTRRERYAIAGGYALRLGQWSLGAEMRVRAEQEYRHQDPRMRGIVTDLSMCLGSGYELGRYRLGAVIEGNIYKQTNSVAFYREEGVIPEYQMTGLGTEYSRFSGDKRSLYYDGGGVALMLHASPFNRNGLYGDITLDEHCYHRKLAEYNSMPLTDLYKEHAGATIGWEKEVNYTIAVFGHFDYTRNTGNEHLGGTSDARYFPVIACLTMYKSHRLEAYVGALLGKANRHIILTAGYTVQSEEYVYPQRQLNAVHLFARLQGQYFLRASNKLLISLNAKASYRARVSEKFVMPFANMSANITQLMRHKYNLAKANHTTIGAKARADYAWKDTRYGLFAELGGDFTFCSVGERQTIFQSSIGITF